MEVYCRIDFFESLPLFKIVIEKNDLNRWVPRSLPPEDFCQSLLSQCVIKFYFP